MTIPGSYTEQQTAIVNEMIGRLRVLQGSGEYVPLGRGIAAGEGLAGGGTLEDDVALSLTEEAMGLLRAVQGRGDLSELVTDQQLADALVPYLETSDETANVIYRDFTITDPPVRDVESPPLRMDVASTVERITVMVGAPTSQPVRVTVGDLPVEVSANTESRSVVAGLTFGEGETLGVSVEATTASSIVVSLRIRES